VLAGETASDAMSTAYASARRQEPAVEVLRRIRDAGSEGCWIVDAEGRLVGRVRSGDLAGVGEEDLQGVAVAGDLASRAVPVAPGTTLSEVLETMDRAGCEEVPVTEPESGRLLGVVSRAAVVRRMRAGG
jgi:CBS domain-containing protein